MFYALGQMFKICKYNYFESSKTNVSFFQTDLTKLLVAQLKEWRVKVTQIFEELSRQVSDLPIIGVLKDKVSRYCHHKTVHLTYHLL